MKPIWVIGAGGHAKVVIDAIREAGAYNIPAILDDAVGAELRLFEGIPVIGPVSHEVLRREGVVRAIIAIGSNQARESIVQRLAGSIEWVTIVHPSAIVAGSASISEGSFIAAGVVIQPGTTLGAHTILNTRSSVDHDCSVGAFAHIAPAACLTGNVSVGDGALLGAGATVVPGCEIGAGSFIGAGAVVVRDIPAHVTAVGVPARIISTREPEHQRQRG